MKEWARILIMGGVFLIGIGLLFYFLSFFPGLGKLPGDVQIKGKNYSFYFPVVSCLVVSLILTVLLNLFFRSR